MAETSSVINISTYPGLDWDKTLELAGGSEDFANELLAMFLDTLPAEISILENAYNQQDYTALLAQAHKIHGALCYCAFLELKQNMLELEKACREEDEAQIRIHYASAMQTSSHILGFIS